VYSRYEKRFREAGRGRLRDLLLLVVKLLAESPETPGVVPRALESTCLVDEYQDTNRAQYRINPAADDEHRNVCVVGDSDQCVVEGTLVQTTRGPKRVEAIEKGDAVIAGSGLGAA